MVLLGILVEDLILWVSENCSAWREDSNTVLVQSSRRADPYRLRDYLFSAPEVSAPGSSRGADSREGVFLLGLGLSGIAITGLAVLAFQRGLSQFRYCLMV